MEQPDKGPDADPAAILRTPRDFLRYAVTRFSAAGLAYGHGSDNAFDEAAFLVLETLGLPIDRIEPFLDARLLPAERQKLAAIIEARVTTRKPAAYLTGRTYTCGIPFRVDERVLVPRSYIGEMLASGTISDILEAAADPTAIDTVLDLCTGSGVLAILAAGAFPNAVIDAADLSADALAVAGANVAEHGLTGRIALHRGDLFAPLGKRRYDLILSNPPYVSAAEMASLPAEYRHEPAMALAGGADGLDIVRRILAGAPRHLNPHGGLLCEIGTGRAVLEDEFPDLPWFWLESAESSGEVFWLGAKALAKHAGPGKQPAPRKHGGAKKKAGKRAPMAG